MFNKKGLIIVTLITMLLMVIGTFYDYSINLAIYEPNSILGELNAMLVPSTCMLCLFTGSALLLKSCEMNNRRLNIKLRILSVLGIIIGLIYAHQGTSYIVRTSIIVMIVDVIINALLALIISNIANTYNRELVRRIGLFLIFAPLVNLLVYTGIKQVWARPRFRFIVKEDPSLFQPWYYISHSIKNTYTAKGILSEEFKSFPSGHTGSATMILCIPVLSHLIQELNEPIKKYGLYVFCFFVIIIGGFLRMRVGAHFLSDVTMGCYVGYLIIYIMRSIFNLNEINRKYY